MNKNIGNFDQPTWWQGLEGVNFFEMVRVDMMVTDLVGCSKDTSRYMCIKNRWLGNKLVFSTIELAIGQKK